MSKYRVIYNPEWNNGANWYLQQKFICFWVTIREYKLESEAIDGMNLAGKTIYRETP